MNRDERTQVSLIDADLNYLIDLLEEQDCHRARLLLQKLKTIRITKDARAAERRAER